MPEIVGSLRPPRLPTSGKPASPAQGEMYFDTTASVLYWWSGTTWVPASGSAGGATVYEQATAPTSPKIGDYWVETDQDVIPGQGPTGPPGPQGVQGPQGPKGDPGSDEFAFVSAINSGPATNVGAQTANAWFALPIGQTAPRVSKPTGLFTQNADGSITIRDAGIYQVDASVTATAAWNAIRLVTALGVGASVTAAVSAQFARQDDTPPASGYPSTALSGAAQFAAGDKLWVLGYGQTSAGSVNVSSLSIFRIGAGPTGPTGATGPTGPGLPAGMSLVGPFQTATAAIAGGVEGSAVYAHGLGKAPVLVLAELEDGSYSGFCSWRVARDATNVTFMVRNNGTVSATVIIRFALLVT